MGISWSGSNSNRRRPNAYYHHHPPQPPPPYYYSSETLSFPPPPPPHQSYFPATSTSASLTNTYPAAHPQPPPSHAQSYYNSHPYGSCSYANHVMGRLHYHPYYYSNQANGWPAIRPDVGLAQPIQPVPYVEHHNAKKVRNDVNVHKNTLKLEIDDLNLDHHLVSFVFDALFDGRITILYFAKEEPNCRFVPLFPEVHLPVKVPFEKGLGQKFCQPSGTGIDLGFFELDDLSKPSTGEDVFPLVIVAESSLSADSIDEHVDESVASKSGHMQITQAVLDKKDGEPFQVRVIRQILWVDGVRYELREIYGIGSSPAEGLNEGDPGKECVICMTEPKDTAVLPCRHMCMCSDCAKALRLQSNKCPICRQPVEELIEININGSNR